MSISDANKLSLEMAECAENGDLNGMHARLIEVAKCAQIEQTHFWHMAINSAWRACEQGHLDCAKLVVEHPRFTGHEHLLYGLFETLKRGHRDVARWLLTQYDVSNLDPFHQKLVLLNAVMGNNLEMVREVLPLVPKKAHRTEALRMACELKFQDIFDHLYPLSNPKQALDYMKQRKTLTDDDRLLLEQAMQANAQHKAISGAVGVESNDGGAVKPKRAPKM